jgi:integrase
MPLVHFQIDLFDAPGSALSGFESAFQSWLQAARSDGQISLESSEEVYRHLWGVLSKWCIQQQPAVRMDDLCKEDLEAFIASRSSATGPAEELSPRYVWRLLHLVDRVLVHRARQHGLARPGAAAQLLEDRPDWRYANAADADPLPDCLSAGEARRLVAFLSAARPRRGRRSVVGKWQELRNRTSVGLQLGAGLGPGDVRALTLRGVTVAGGRLAGVPWKLRVPAIGASPERETPIAGWAGQLLAHWLQVRAEAGVQGEYLFPSTRTGKPWGKVAQYLASKLVLEDAGFDEVAAKGGSFRLRHTFALRQLARGKAAEDIARWLGVVDPAVMVRYQRVLAAPVDDLA